MTWVTKRVACLHPGLLAASMSVAFGAVDVGSTWRCDSCRIEWVVVSTPDGRRLERSGGRA